MTPRVISTTEKKYLKQRAKFNNSMKLKSRFNPFGMNAYQISRLKNKVYDLRNIFPTAFMRRRAIQNIPYNSTPRQFVNYADGLIRNLNTHHIASEIYMRRLAEHNNNMRRIGNDIRERIATRKKKEQDLLNKNRRNKTVIVYNPNNNNNLMVGTRINNKPATSTRRNLILRQANNRRIP